MSRYDFSPLRPFNIHIKDPRGCWDLHGTNIKGLLAGANSLDFDTKGVKATSVNALQEIPLPAIAHVTLDGGLLYYVVIHKVKNGKIYVADPAQGLVTYTLADFCRI